MKTQTFKFLVILTLTFASHAFALNCETDALKQKFLDLNIQSGGEAIAFESGWRQPACGLNFVATLHRRLRQSAAVKAIDAIPDSIFTPAFKKYLEANNNYERWSSDRIVEVMWPPNDARAKAIEVSAAQRRQFEDKNIGAIPLAELRRTTAYYGPTEREDDRRTLLTKRQLRVADLDSRMRRIFQVALDKAIAKLKAGPTKTKADPKMTAVALKRLETLGLYPSRNPLEFSCEGVYAARYEPFIHQVVVPYSLAAVSNESLLRTLAHEIAHSFDGLRLSQALATYKRDDANREPDSVVREVRLESGAKYILKDPENTDKFVEATGRVFSAGVAEAANPFRSVYQCLAKDKRILAGRKLATSSQMKHEIFADWFAAEIVADVMKDSAALATVRMKASDLIDDRESTGTNPLFMPSGFEFVSFYIDSMASGDDVSVDHPAWSRRLSEIFLRNPDVRIGLQCDSPTTPLPPKCDW